MNYKSLYKELAYTLSELGCVVCDHDFKGYCYQTKDARGFIVISPNTTYKERYFILAHEAGHLFYMKKGNRFKWSKKPRSEGQANWFAIQLLRLNGMDSTDYNTSYQKAVKAVAKRKKSWFED